MIRVVTRLRREGDFLVRSSTQTVWQDIHHSVVLRHENAVVSGMILRFSRRFYGHAFGLSAVVWSPFRPIQSRRVKLPLRPRGSNVFFCKKRALGHQEAVDEISHLLARERQHNFYAVTRAISRYFLPDQTRWGPESSTTSTVRKVDFIKAGKGKRRCVTSTSDPPLPR